MRYWVKFSLFRWEISLIISFFVKLFIIKIFLYVFMNFKYSLTFYINFLPLFVTYLYIFCSNKGQELKVLLVDFIEHRAETGFGQVMMKMKKSKSRLENYSINLFYWKKNIKTILIFYFGKNLEIFVVLLL